MSAIEVSFIYADRDKRMLAQLEKIMEPLRDHGFITWHDCSIGSISEKYNQVITFVRNFDDDFDSKKTSNIRSIERSQIISLLVSPAFLKSNYFSGQEMQRLLERHEHHEATVIPIILQPAPWRRTLLGELQSLPIGGKAVSTWSDPDAAFFSIAQGILRIARELDVQSSQASTVTSATQIPSNKMEEEVLDDLAHGLRRSFSYLQEYGDLFRISNSSAEKKKIESAVTHHFNKINDMRIRYLQLATNAGIIASEDILQNIEDFDKSKENM